MVRKVKSMETCGQGGRTHEGILFTWLMVKHSLLYKNLLSYSFTLYALLQCPCHCSKLKQLRGKQNKGKFLFNCCSPLDELLL